MQRSRALRPHCHCHCHCAPYCPCSPQRRGVAEFQHYLRLEAGGGGGSSGVTGSDHELRWLRYYQKQVSVSPCVWIWSQSHTQKAKICNAGNSMTYLETKGQ